LFVRNFVGVKDNEPIASHLDIQAYSAWVLLFVSLICGMVFYWSSAKYVKVVCGGKESMSEASFETIRDGSIFGMVLAFVFGLLCLFWFFCRL